MKPEEAEILLQTSSHPLKTRVLGIGGSPRKNGNSDILLSSIVQGVSLHQISSETFHLRDLQYQACIGCELCRKDMCCTGLTDDMDRLYPHVAASKGLVLVCPTHNYNITAWMKGFIDRLYSFYIFDDNRPRGWSSRLGGQGRKAVIAAVCEQKDKRDMGFSLEAMRMPLEALGYEIVEELAVFGIFDRGGVDKEKNTLAEALNLGVKLSEAMR